MKTAEEIGKAALARLAAQTTANRAASEQLRAEVRAVIAQGSDHLTAKQVIERLTRQPPPSIRRVQEILTVARRSGPAAPP